jgi:hypothetical protein
VAAYIVGMLLARLDLSLDHGSGAAGFAAVALIYLMFEPGHQTPYPRL